MRIEQLLGEARKNPHLNPKIDAEEIIRKYISKGGHFFHFSNLSLISLHPEPYYKTPLGIYAYTPEEVKEALSGADGDIDNLPYAADSENIYIIKPTNELIDLLKYNNYDSDSKKIIDFFVNYIKKNWGDGEHVGISTTILKELVYKSKERYRNEGIAIWKLVYDIIRKFIKDPSAYYELRQFELEPKEVNDAKITNTIFREVLGWEGAIDNGSGTIHPNEPSQVIFFHRGALDVVELVKNTSYSARQRRKRGTRSLSQIKREFNRIIDIIDGGRLISGDIDNNDYEKIIEFFDEMTKVVKRLPEMDADYNSFTPYNHPQIARFLTSDNFHKLAGILVNRAGIDGEEELIRDYSSKIKGKDVHNTIALFKHANLKSARNDLIPSAEKFFSGYLELFKKYK